MPDSTRATELDAMRGIAAFAVVVFHACENLPDRDLLLLRVMRGTPSRLFLDGREPVIFFFVLSGLVLTRALLSPHAPGWPSYALRRVVRLCLPAAAAVVLSAVLYTQFHSAGAWPEPDTWLAVTSWTHAPTAQTMLRHVALTGADGDFQLDCVLWTLVHELRLSLLLPLAIVFAVGRGRDDGRREHRSVVLLLLAGAMLFGLALGDSFGGDDFAQRLGAAATLGAVIHGCLPVAVFAAIAWRAGLSSAVLQAARQLSARDGCLLVCGLLSGIVLGARAGGINDLMLGPDVAHSLLATLCFAPCFLLGAALSLFGLDRFGSGPEQRAFCLLGGVMLLSFSGLFAIAAASLLLILAVRGPVRVRAVLRGRELVFLGRISFSLYLVHVPLLLGLSHGLHDVLPMEVILALWIPLTIPAAWIFCVAVDEPAQRLARRIGAARAIPA